MADDIKQNLDDFARFVFGVVSALDYAIEELASIEYFSNNVGFRSLIIRSSRVLVKISKV